MTRTNEKWIRPYTDGLAICGVARQVGSYGVTIDAPPDAAFCDAVMNVSLGRGSIKCGPINAFLAPAAAPTGLHELASSGLGTRTVMIAQGIGAEPVAGDPMFSWIFEQAGYEIVPGNGGFVAVNVALPAASYLGSLNYLKPFGYLLHGEAAETAANTAVGVVDSGASSALGGIFCYQLLTSNGTVTLSADDSATNANNAAFAALSGATSGSIDASVTPKGGMIQLSTSATVRRYLRFQVAFGTATTATFISGFIRQN